MNHEFGIESGNALGPLVHWVRCTCGWIGPAAETVDMARIEAAKAPHAQLVAGDRS